MALKKRLGLIGILRPPHGACAVDKHAARSDTRRSGAQDLRLQSRQLHYVVRLFAPARVGAPGQNAKPGAWRVYQRRICLPRPLRRQLTGIALDGFH